MLVLPSLRRSIVAVSPSMCTRSISMRFDSSGTSATLTRADCNAAAVRSAPRFDKVVRGSSMPRRGKTLSFSGPSMRSVRPVLSLTACSICGLY